LILDCDTFYTFDIISDAIIRDSNTIYYFIDNGVESLFSYIQMDNDNKITNIREKERITNNANTGAYFFKDITELHKYVEIVIDNNIKFRSEYYVSCIYSEMIRDKIDVFGKEINRDLIYFLGTPQQVDEYIKRTYAFLFDLDGTLIETDKIYFDVWKQILNKYNIFLTDDIYHTFIHGNNDIKIISKLLSNSNANIDEISHMKDDLFIKNIDNVVVKKDVHKFLSKIRENAHKICIVTNCNRNVATKIISHFGLDKYIDLMIIGNECNKPKPYPDPYLTAIDKLHISNNKSIIFEDSKTGLLSALGTYPKCIVGIINGNNSESLLESGANIIIKDFDIELETLFNYSNCKISKIETMIRKSLSNRMNIDKITINNNKLKGGYISDVIELTIKLVDSYDIINCVLKLENKQTNKLSDMAKLLDLYGREYYFYENIYNYVNICVPKFYGIIKDDDFNSVGLLLENLNTDDFILNLNLNKKPISVSLDVIDILSKFHARFWNKPLKNTFKDLTTNNSQKFDWNNFINEKWPQFKNRWCNILGNDNINIAEIIVKEFKKITDHLSKDNLTLCHGDVKSPNMFYKKIGINKYDPYFIDWQYIIIGKGVQDLVFFMIESFDIDIINRYAIMFKEYYYIKLLENNVKNYSKEEYDLDYQIAICYFPVFVGIWFGTVDSDDLIDKNFPFFFIQKLFNFINNNVNIKMIQSLT